MRHQSISQTLDTYGHLMPGATEGAVEALAAWSDPTPSTERRTGTDGPATLPLIDSGPG